MTKLLLTVILIVCSGLSYAQNIPNPVIPKVADAGVMKYNGKYFIGGVRTYGDVYVSENLIDWGKPIHVVTMDNEWTKGTRAGDNQIHANDMFYLNGDFHLYWSVNYWGQDRHAVHIVHSTSKFALGPYYEPDRTTWLDNRIDPKVFRDDDGQLYMYMVRFTDGNTIWCRKMKNPAEFESDPIYIFASQPNSWETMDNRVIEGPWVMKYRDQYYMMYNANHTGHTWGNYQLGVAQADGPLQFNTGNKYSYPVVGSNQTPIEDEYIDLLRYFNNTYNPYFYYTENNPSDKSWTTAKFDPSNWKEGVGGFASHVIEGSTVRFCGTKWDSDTLWLRKSFYVGHDTGNLALRVTHDDNTRIWLNGKLIYDANGSGYCMVNLDKEQAKALKKGENIIAAESKGGKHSKYFDVSLFDLKDNVADDILFTPGQPNILRGPNGFEWWLIYMANINGGSRDQYVNRVQFFDRTLYVDGITGPNTKGYHPYPALPTYSILKKTTATGAFSNQKPSEAYLVESNVNTSGNAGVIVWWKDENNNAKVGLDAASNSWYLEVAENGKTEKKQFLMPSDFKWGVFHSVRVERYNGDLKIFIDDLPAPETSKFVGVIPETAGVAGLYDNSGDAVFEGTIYTIGFDDIDVTLSSDTEKIMGDALSNYEMSVQLYGIDQDKSAGAYLAYVDNNNYVKAVFNGSTGNVELIVKYKGSISKKVEYPLAKTSMVYPDVKYTDSMDKGYRFASPTWLNAIYINRHDADNKADFTDNMFEKMTVEYLANGKWHQIDRSNVGIADNPMYNVLNFNQVKAEGLRFINSVATDLQRHIYKIGIGEQLKESYNLRTVRDNDKLYLFIDGKQIDCVDIKKMPASKVGLCESNYQAQYRGMLYYHINKDSK